MLIESRPITSSTAMKRYCDNEVAKLNNSIEEERNRFQITRGHKLMKWSPTQTSTKMNLSRTTKFSRNLHVDRETPNIKLYLKSME